MIFTENQLNWSIQMVCHLLKRRWTLLSVFFLGNSIFVHSIQKNFIQRFLFSCVVEWGSKWKVYFATVIYLFTSRFIYGIPYWEVYIDLSKPIWSVSLVLENFRMNRRTFRIADSCNEASQYDFLHIVLSVWIMMLIWIWNQWIKNSLLVCSKHLFLLHHPLNNRLNPSRVII